MCILLLLLFTHVIFYFSFICYFFTVFVCNRHIVNWNYLLNKTGFKILCKYRLKRQRTLPTKKTFYTYNSLKQQRWQEIRTMAFKPTLATYTFLQESGSVSFYQHYHLVKLDKSVIIFLNENWIKPTSFKD